MVQLTARRPLSTLVLGVFALALAFPVALATAQDRPFIPLDHPKYAEIAPAAGPHYQYKAKTNHGTVLRGAKERARQAKLKELIQQKEAEQREKSKYMF